ncbi:tRNA synthetases class I-domain-containing protein [Polychytrium aggregatum]|uniref:tRNA synthetases class I-domain-containing protein n=1 Tax=Polychytrium aggregatum TaxID=110093 RepID=UPI0022FE1D5B|nr:tRNA synthetases class I-domain-containing protein [Polychytrium aggregatum]KAI9203065.1 tRNA synthetases class I-domain-containing protein [Polychytrium aggregatum]
MSNIEVPANISFPKEEERIQEFWKEIDAFKTSLKLSEGRPPFSFYDGPPFATGLPHYGHLLAGTIKDTVTRYAHQTGHYVERRFGWDTHGLPVEYEIDKKLGIKGPEDVKKMGIEAYNAECRAIVMRYAEEWESTVTRMGRWIDFKNDYKTLNPSFMESVWWVFKQLYEKDQVYRGFRILPYSTAICTSLSNFEANQNYKDAIDPSVVVSFPLKNDPEVSLLAWTTTPWTLPSNLALCVNPNFDYVKIKDGESGKIWILMEKRLEILYKDVKKAKFTVLDRMKGSDLKGLEYVPLFPYFSHRQGQGSFVVVNDTYVTEEGGTGVVHQAPAFGEDDYRVCLQNKVIKNESDLVCPIDAVGRFTKEVPDYAGQYIKDADKEIQKDLKKRERLIRQTQFSHSYPFCYRSDTPLIYKAVPSWFVRVSNINEKLLANNDQTYWVPDFVKDKRFANWLADARDWNISRNRYWGTPIPLWVSEDFEEIVAIGSVAELEELSGVTGITDLHRDSIDHITIPSKKGKGQLRRVEEVFDCWFESGSMPYAQQHYPFENQQKFESTFPADFIAEGLDQTRGWFYTLLVLSTHLFDRPPFKNVIVNGLVLAADGKKMSKRLKNYPDPNVVMDTHGADVLRLYLINSPVVRAEPLRFKEEGVKELVAKVFLPWYNAYRFFFSQVALLKKEHGIEYKYNETALNTSTNVMDRWILANTQRLIAFVHQEMAAYRLYTVVPRLLKLIDELTNWYVRFNRKRLKGDNGPEDAVQALDTLYEVLFTLVKTMSPFTPHITESMYQNLRQVHANLGSTDTRSVHFLMMPQAKAEYFNADIERAVARMQTVIEQVRVIRDKKTIPLKTPLKELIIINADSQYLEDIKAFESYIVEEVNVRTITVTSDEKAYGVKYKIETDKKNIGIKYKKDAAKINAAAKDFSEVDIAKFVKTRELEVAGFTLGEEDLKIIRYFENAGDYEAEFDRENLTILDCTLDQNLIQEGLAREVINRIQRLRKKAGLQATDEITYYYELQKDPQNELETVLSQQQPFLSKSLKQDVVPVSQKPAGAQVIIAEEQEVNNSTFVLTFTVMRDRSLA